MWSLGRIRRSLRWCVDLVVEHLAAELSQFPEASRWREQSTETGAIEAAAVDNTPEEPAGWLASSFLGGIFCNSTRTGESCVGPRKPGSSFSESVDFLRVALADPNFNLTLIGSSWGGLCALALVAELGVFPARTIVIAPALRANGPLPALLWPDFVHEIALPCEESSDGKKGLNSGWQRPGKPVLLIQGDADSTVPVEAARAYKERWSEHIRYVEVPDGDHKMVAELQHGGEGGLRHWVEADAI